MDVKIAPRILIVDDDLNLCKTLAAVLQTAGYSAKSVTSGEQALKAIEEQFFDIALVDIKLPDTESTE